MTDIAVRRGAPDLTITLVDGLPMYRDGLSALAYRTPGMRVVGVATAARSGLSVCERTRPDVAVLDSALDPQHRLIRALTATGLRTSILLLVGEAQRSSRYVSGAIAAGAHGVVPRIADRQGLLNAIHAVHAARSFVDPSLSELLAAPAGVEAPPVPDRMPLSKRELQVLRLVADGLENLRIAELLFLSVETVRSHVKNILRKLAARDRTHAVAVAFRTGVLTPDEVSQE